MEIKTIISSGYRDLLEIFFKANELDVQCLERDDEQFSLKRLITLRYEDDSDTAYKITFMSFKHLGLENMLCDYLIKLGYPPARLSDGRTIVKRDMKKLDEEWDEYCKNNRRW